jgi:hypothetical protein
MSPNNFPVLGYDDLNTFQKSAAGNNFLLNLGPGISGAKLDMRTWSPEAQVGTSFAQGFLGALFQGMGRDQVADQTRQAAALLPLLYQSPESVQAPEGVDPQAFEALRGAAQLTKLQQQAFRQQQAQELWNELYKENLLQQFKAEAEAAGAGKKRFAEVLGENTAWDAIRNMSAGEGEIGEITNPKDPRYQVNQDRLALAERLRKEFTGRPENVKFNEVADRYNVLKMALSDPSSISDNDFVVGLAKILDPGSVVRESEGQKLIDSQSIPASILGQLNTALQGGQALSPEARVNFLEMAGRHYTTLKEKTDALRGQYSRIASQSGLSADDILPPMVAGPQFGADQLSNLAARFPPTPEGRAAFKRAVDLLRK